MAVRLVRKEPARDVLIEVVAECAQICTDLAEEYENGEERHKYLMASAAMQCAARIYDHVKELKKRGVIPSGNGGGGQGQNKTSP